MERRVLRQRLHLSGMDSRAADMARARGLGFEITEFCWAPRLEQPDAMALVRRQIEGVRHLWLHAPFAELSPCSIDPLVRATALHRFRQTIETAQALGVTRLVVHGGFIPLVYFPEWFVEQSVLFWRELLADVPEGMVLAVENVMEPGPEMLVQIAGQVNDPRLGQGTIPMEQVLDTLLELCPAATFTIENQDCAPSLDWLAQRGYLEE